MNLSIVIPCYNESENIPHIISRLHEVLLNSCGLEVILVDNGSNDKTQEVLSKELTKPNNSFIRSVKVPKNIGFGHGVMAGIRESKCEIIAWTHADLQTDVADIFRGYEKFIKQPKPENTFLRGVRKKRPLIDELFTWGMGLISTLALGKKMHNINAQPKMFHRSFLDLMQNPPDDFSLELYILYLAKKNRMNIIELPVYFKKRLYGEAKGGGGSSLKTKFKLIKRTFAYVFKLKREIRSGER